MLAIIRSKRIEISASAMPALLFTLFLSSDSPEETFNWELAAVLEHKDMGNIISQFIGTYESGPPPCGVNREARPEITEKKNFAHFYAKYSVTRSNTPNEKVNDKMEQGSIIGAYEAISDYPVLGLNWKPEHDQLVKHGLQYSGIPRSSSSSSSSELRLPNSELRLPNSELRLHHPSSDLQTPSSDLRPPSSDAPISDSSDPSSDSTTPSSSSEVTPSFSTPSAKPSPSLISRDVRTEEGDDDDEEEEEHDDEGDGSDESELTKSAHIASKMAAAQAASQLESPTHQPVTPSRANASPSQQAKFQVGTKRQLPPSTRKPRETLKARRHQK
jgi:hypothetical protein